MSDLDMPNDSDLEIPSELDMLRQRAKLMGIKYSPNASVERLKEQIAEKLAGNSTETDAGSGTAEAAVTTTQEQATEVQTLNPLAGESVNEPVKKKPQTLRQKLYEENMRLVRVRVTCLDPKKKDLPGEIFTVANEYLGTVRKYVPFGEQTDNGYHIPYCIYKQMKNRKFLSIKTSKGKGAGQQIKIEQQMVREFALEILEPLTSTEIAKLAAAQSAAGNVD